MYIHTHSFVFFFIFWAHEGRWAVAYLQKGGVAAGKIGLAHYSISPFLFRLLSLRFFSNQRSKITFWKGEECVRSSFFGTGWSLDFNLLSTTWGRLDLLRVSNALSCFLTRFMCVASNVLQCVTHCCSVWLTVAVYDSLLQCLTQCSSVWLTHSTAAALWLQSQGDSTSR